MKSTTLELTSKQFSILFLKVSWDIFYTWSTWPPQMRKHTWDLKAISSHDRSQHVLSTSLTAAIVLALSSHNFFTRHHSSISVTADMLKAKLTPPFYQVGCKTKQPGSFLQWTTLLTDKLHKLEIISEFTNTLFMPKANTIWWVFIGIPRYDILYALFPPVLSSVNVHIGEWKN